MHRLSVPREKRPLPSSERWRYSAALTASKRKPSTRYASANLGMGVKRAVILSTFRVGANEANQQGSGLPLGRAGEPAWLLRRTHEQSCASKRHSKQAVAAC